MSLAAQLLIALLVTATFAILAYALGMISRNGAIGGLLVGTVIYASLGPQGFAVLALFVVGGSLLTRFGYRRKQSTGTAQDQGGRRGARNAIANCAVAVSCALIAGAMAACLTATLALTLGLLQSPQSALLVALAALLGTVADSLIGARYPRIGNEATNVLCTLVAAVLAPILT